MLFNTRSFKGPDGDTVRITFYRDGEPVITSLDGYSSYAPTILHHDQVIAMHAALGEYIAACKENNE